jgi:hypothetical protein
MGWSGARKRVALIVLALLALVVLVNRLDRGSADSGKGITRELRACKDKDGYNTPCPLPPEVRKSPEGR